MYEQRTTVNGDLFPLSLEGYRNPLRLELFREVVPLCVFVFFIAMGLGYAWAMAAFRSFSR